MALRIPPRRSPILVTLVQALNHVCGEMIGAETAEPAETTDSDPANLVAVIAGDEAAARKAREHSQIAADVANALLEAIKDGRLPVEGVPAYELEVWRSRLEILDWQTGRFTLAGPEIPYTLRQFHTPLVSLSQAVSLFEEPPEQTGETRPEPAGQIDTKRTTGPKPLIREGIRKRILAALRAGRAITDADHDALTREFGEGASRTTCIAALREALSEFERENSDTNSDKC